MLRLRACITIGLGAPLLAASLCLITGRSSPPDLVAILAAASSAAILIFVRAQPAARRSVRRVSMKCGLAALALTLLAMSCLLAPFLTPHQPTELGAHPDVSRLGPTLEHPLGTDAMGRDVVSRTLHGGRPTLAVAIVATIAATCVGTLAAAVGAFGPTWADQVLAILTDALLGVPRIVIVLALVALIGQQASGSSLLLWMALFIGLTSWMSTARIVRAGMIDCRSRGFVESARALGLTEREIVFRHVLPNCAHLVLASALLSFIWGAGVEATLAFLGQGIVVGSPSWGAMISDARTGLPDNWLPFAAPLVALGVVAFGGTAVVESLQARAGYSS